MSHLFNKDANNQKDDDHIDEKQRIHSYKMNNQSSNIDRLWSSDLFDAQDRFQYMNNHQSSNKNWLWSIGLITLLIWGSSFLVLGIARLRESSVQLKQLEILTQSSTSSIKNILRGYKDDQEVLTLGSDKVLGFDEIRNSSFSANFKPIQWISEPDSLTNDKGTFVTFDNDLYLIKSVYDKEYENLLYNGSKITVKNEEYEIERLVASPNLKYALISTNHSQNWRHSSFAFYWILNVETQEISKLHEDKISIAKWSPISDKVAFVLENNIYVYDLSTQNTNQSTFDGDAQVFNGKPDWVYEEEVLEGDSALWWSPNGEFISFLRANDTLVSEFQIPYFVQGDAKDVYPEVRSLKYPKPGYNNPDVSVGVINVNKQTTELIGYKYGIFTEILWVGNDQLLIKATNRESDFLKVVLVNAQDLSFEIVRDEVTDSWFEITHDTLFIPKSTGPDAIREDDGYLDTISVNGFNHLAYFSPPNNSTPKILTQGDWEVVSAPSAFNYEKNLIYYISTKKSSIERHLYSLNLITGETEQLTKGEGWFSASFSSGARFVSLSYRGPNIPYQKLVDLETGEDEFLEDNDKLSRLLDTYDLPIRTYGEVDIGTAIVNYVERLPPHFDENKKYPVLFFVYGGPNSQLVTKTFGFQFPDVVASQLNAIVVTVDGRGTGFKGRQFRSIVRDKLGHHEVIDQILAAKIWARKSYVDESRFAIFGWSYGGYMTLKTLELDAGNTFQYGMSVAPVTDWRFYDSVYTERYMHTPENNSKGYERSSVSNVTRLSETTRFLLCHGTGDDNVHFQNSLKFLDDLNLANVENYDVHIFPDSDHAIRYHNANVIIYDKLLLWLKKAFRGDYINYD
ncbi:hypothetical protein BN7_5993 [Wickerhamomyces ciferrii]|uniref:Uncharacterized protein n=1 Tax=Wickerhamomyces ciferrii (strain ATCC 14091 / BCRC 22168 / CBS 111 / JCM 3599 / NBRC 0793 / NRRL Y-1031 F-60-10) TaxID=1206466 RepID=K0KMB2_WICCF|nr:uncharacterized protein BN7_5993 [Wickerhamomyces ciferrii]CCH46400.1 hypothetical protein BN7_5993 [Wickerhamomyces ciferrii]